jgi:hypothetical protein
MAAELAIADGVALVLAELLVVLVQPVNPMIATTPTSAKRRARQTVLAPIPEVCRFVIAIDSPCVVGAEPSRLE